VYGGYNLRSGEITGGRWCFQGRELRYQSDHRVSVRRTDSGAGWFGRRRGDYN